MESFDADVRCLSETRLQNPSNVLTLTCPTNRGVAYHLRLSGDAGAALTTGMAEAAVLD